METQEQGGLPAGSLVLSHRGHHHGCPSASPLVHSPWCLRQHRTCLQCGRPGLDPWVGKIPWRREWLPTLVLLPAESHEQKSLVGYSPWGHRESDTAETLSMRRHSCPHTCPGFHRVLPRLMQSPSINAVSQILLLTFQPIPCTTVKVQKR